MRIHVLRAMSCNNQRALRFVVSCASAICGSLRRTLSAGRRKLHNTDGPARMMVTHLNLAEVQDRQAVAPFVRELAGRQRNPVLGLMAPELPHCLNTHGRAEVCLRVDHTSCVLYVLRIVRLKRSPFVPK